MEFEILKGRFSFHLTAPYSGERRRAASEAAKKCGTNKIGRNVHKNLLKQFQKESGYNDVFIPAMQRLSPAYREYHKSLQAANEVFLRHFQQE